MKRIKWIGWLLAGLLLLQNARMGLAAPSSTDPLEGRLLHPTSGSFYVYHDGMKFAVQLASTGDQVIAAIPDASEAQWDSLFLETPAETPAAPSQPEQQPSHCNYCFS